jgi:peptide deformylase
MKRPLGLLACLLGCGHGAAGGERHAAPAKPPPAAASPIVQIGAPVLRARAAEVPAEKVASPEMRALYTRMIEVMRAAPGVGLAAPQIGVGLRVIVLEDRAELMAKITPAERAERERAPFGPRVIVNPVLRATSDEKATFFEGCLSVSGYVGLVTRAAEVEVTGLDETGAPVTWRVRGWPARILQHEVDHVDGTVYVDRMITRSFSTGSEAQARFAGKPIADVLRALDVTPQP